MTEVSRRRALQLAAVGALALGCPKTDQSLVLIGGDTVSAADIDSQPLRVLPRGALLISKLDAAALFRSGLGAEAAKLIANIVPLGRESNFAPSRDVTMIYSAFYAMQGADFCAVVQGRFDVDAIRRAADARSQTPSGVPLVKTHYAGNDIYTVSNIGFAVLTANTIVSGNETGMRRALDRIRVGKLAEDLPPWMRQTLDQQKEGAFATVGDLRGQGAIAAAGERLPFVLGLENVRFVGNFKAPGMNVVGTLGYGDEEQAKAGAAGLGELQQFAYLVTLLSSFGFGGQMPQLTIETKDKDVNFAAEIDAGTIQLIVGLLVQATQPRGSSNGWVN